MKSFKKRGLKEVKKALTLLAIVLFIALAITMIESHESSALTTVVDDWVLSGDTITIEEQTFAIYLSTKLNEIVADYGSGSLFIANNSCASTDLARICLDNVQYDFTDRVSKIQIRGISLAPDITITRSVSSDEFLVGDETVFTATITNEGGLATNITYTEEVPKEFTVTETDGVTFKDGKVTWNGKLQEGESFVIIYNVKAKNPFDGGLVASLTYHDGLRLNTLYSSKITLKTTPSIILSNKIGATTTLLGERNNVTVNLSNRFGENVNVENLEIIFDPGIMITSRPYGLKKVNDNKYTWSGILPKVNITLNKSKSWFFEFKGTRVGNSDIIARASYIKDKDTTTTVLPEKKQSFTTLNKGVIVRTSLSDKTLEARQRGRLRIWVQNLNPLVELKDVEINISTAGLVSYVSDSFLSRMAAHHQELVVDDYFFAPDLETGKGYTIVTNITYLTEYGDNFSKDFTDTVNVQPTQKVTLSKSVSQSSLKADEESEVTVEIKNARPTKLKNVRVEDKISGDFTVIGKSSAVLEIPIDGNVKAYSYKIKAPRYSKETILHVNTTMTYSDEFNSEKYDNPQVYTETESTAITIKPEEFDVSLTRTIADSEIYLGEVFDVEYKVENKETDKVARNIVLTVPLTKNFDLINGERNITIERLNPGEIIAVADFEKRRGKLGGTYSFEKSSITYENIFGDTFETNSSSNDVEIKNNYVKGPIVSVYKTAQAEVNNTDVFEVVINATNTGNEEAYVTITDNGKSYQLKVPKESTSSISYDLRIPKPGDVDLPKAEGKYSYDGKDYRTASDLMSLSVLDNPVIRIEKTVPSTVSNVEEYSVRITLTNTANIPVKDITLTDGEKTWNFVNMDGSEIVNVSYDVLSKNIGYRLIDAASVKFNYEGEVYNTISNTPELTVKETKIISIVKEVKPKAAKAGEEVNVTLRFRNLQNEPIDVVITDNGETFTDRLLPEQRRNASYITKASSTTLEPAIATFTFNDQDLTASSEEPDFILKGKIEEPETNDDEGNIFSKLIKSILNVLTWKRG
jgi:hypothetical protein